MEGARKRRSTIGRSMSRRSRGRYKDKILKYLKNPKTPTQPTIKGLSRLMLWEKTWLNPKWRRRWRKKWGKNRWKSKLRFKWKTNREWRRKWMKKLRKNWWNMKWRRLWQKCWLDPTWWAKLEKERKRRKRYWMKKWRTSGCKTMGLTFHQFLVTQRRLKAMKNVRPGVIQLRRKEKRLAREMLISQKQMKREMFDEDRKKYCFFLRRWFHFLFETEHYGPETYGLRPAVIQFKLYLMNAIQGLCAFAVVLFLNISNNSSGLTPAMALQGLFFIVYSATAMDFFGSIFGMLTSYHLESYYGQQPYVQKKSKKRRQCLACLRPNNIRFKQRESKAMLTPSESQITLEQESIVSGKYPKGITSSSWDIQSWKYFVKGGKRKTRTSAQPSNISTIFKEGKFEKSSTKDSLVSDDLIFLRKPSEGTIKTEDGRSNLEKRRVKGKMRSNASLKTKEKKECECTGLKFLYCGFLRKCFQAGRSRKFINTMGYISWIFLELGWFFNLFYVCYYSWIKHFSAEYAQLLVQCSILPIQLHCYNFNQLYYQMLIIVAAIFMIRNMLLFLIGMCFNERYLKHIPPCEPNYEVASTASDTDIDYDKVPRQILIPYLLSNGRYPYTYPGSGKAKKKIKKDLRKVLKEKAKKKAQERMEGREERHRRRILCAREKEAEKVMQGFRGIRRAQVPLPKGRRKQFKIPVITGVPDTVQLPPELMTTSARAWLSEDDTSDTSESVFKNKRMSQPRRRRKRRKRGEIVESNSLIVLHGDKSGPIPVDEAIHRKVQKIETRLSTDQSWTSDGSVYQYRTGYQAEAEDYNDDNDEEYYMELMKLNEEIRNANKRE